jgi:hypothetical protein
MRSEDIDEDETASTDQSADKRKSSTLRNLMQTMHTVDIFKKQKKEEVKVRLRDAYHFVVTRSLCNKFYFTCDSHLARIVGDSARGVIKHNVAAAAR